MTEVLLKTYDLSGTFDFIWLLLHTACALALEIPKLQMLGVIPSSNLQLQQQIETRSGILQDGNIGVFRSKIASLPNQLKLIDENGLQNTSIKFEIEKNS
ncbi:hypothetical protein TNCV_499841 [Trichonephila clavipes]|nr:hypothetical protein TNCV_499841 [Trichonephila clavipes]